MQLKLDHTWLKETLSTYPILIAGPCSAESEAQLLDVAHNLKNITNIQYFRAGVWKPRTRPNCFEGIGVAALKWLQAVKEQTGLKIMIEVANANHVEQALAHGVDALWIGARTTANPFAVEEIATAVESIDVPVFVKNPINPDLALWMGAIERLQNRGITKIMAIHRGFSTFSSQKYRNSPMWKIPMELKRIFPELPIICDPSHIGGQRAFIASLSQKAYDLGLDGLMIETHPDPSSALSDSKQQITPEVLKETLARLIYKTSTIDNNDVKKQINHYRELIDDIDIQILDSLKERQNIVKDIGVLKRSHKMTAFQVQRLDELLDMRRSMGINLGLSEDLVHEVFNSIHEDSVRFQTKIIE